MSATSQHRSPHFVAAKQLRNGCEAPKHENSQFRSQSSIPQGVSQLRNQFWHTSAISQHSDPHFAAVKWAAKIVFFCENPLLLRNRPSSTKIKITFNIPLFFIKTGHLSCKRVLERENAIATVCSFPRPSPTTREPPVISSGHHFRPNFVSPIWREPEEPNLPLLSTANESRERRLFKAPPLNLRGQKLLHLRRSPHHKILRRGVISPGQGVVPCKRKPGSKAQSP